MIRKSEPLYSRNQSPLAKILIMTSEFPPFKGGIGTYALEIATAAVENGDDVTVVAPDYGVDQTGFDKNLPFRVVRFRGGVPTMRGMPRKISIAVKMLFQKKYDIVHAVDWPFFIPVRLASRHPQQKRILTLHGSEVRYMQAPKRKFILRLLGFWRSGWATWISNSNYTNESALSSFPIAREDTRAVPLGVSAKWINGRIDRMRARTELDVSDEIVLVSLGRVVPRKGHADLAEALSQLPDELCSRISWWIIGPLLDPAHIEKLQTAIGNLCCKTSIFGSLPEEQVQLRMSAADIFCLPGYEDDQGAVEGFGLVFLEAAAYGVPSIATISGGIPEAVDDGISGLLVAERDTEALADALSQLITSREYRDQLAEGALEKAARSSWRRTMLDTYAAN